MRALVLAALVFVAAPAVAQSPAAPASTRAILADAATAPSSGRTIVDGATWRCEGSTCTTTGGSNQPATRACRRVVAKIGRLTEFSWKGTQLSAQELATCNG